MRSLAMEQVAFVQTGSEIRKSSFLSLGTKVVGFRDQIR
jgi:hypothetical protein